MAPRTDRTARISPKTPAFSATLQLKPDALRPERTKLHSAYPATPQRKSAAPRSDRPQLNSENLKSDALFGRAISSGIPEYSGLPEELLQNFLA